MGQRGLFKIAIYQVLLLLVFGMSCGSKPKPSSIFPETLPNLHLIKLIKGKKAIEEINKLHGRQIHIKRGFIAYYEGSFEEGNWREATIWLSEADNGQTALKQTKIMMDRIKNNPKTPFHHFKERSRQGIRVYTFWGMGKAHAVFQKGKQVYWITATEDVFEPVLRAMLTNKSQRQSHLKRGQ